MLIGYHDKMFKAQKPEGTFIRASDGYTARDGSALYGAEVPIHSKWRITNDRFEWNDEDDVSDLQRIRSVQGDYDSYCAINPHTIEIIER